MKILKRVLLIAFLLILGVALFYVYPRLTIISGYAAKNMASSVYIAHRSPSSITENDNNVPLIKLANTTIEGADNRVSSSVFGLRKRTTICRDGLGCALVISGTEPFTGLKPKRTTTNSELPFPYGDSKPKDTLFANVNYSKIESALDRVFSDPDNQRTRTALIVYKDHIIGERYIEGFDETTPILGWSMTKSILATLYGVLEYQGVLTVGDKANIEAWKDDERQAITINHLLRMQSGLAWDEDYASISDVNKMLFLAPDVTKPQVEKEAIAAPTEIWNYSSGTSNLLSGILRTKFSSHQDYLNFPYTALIDKIGMHSMLIETDLEGNFVGSSYGWANTRDWAKFGLLYLHRGNWNGTQLFAPEWVDYSARPTNNSNGTYGAHFWLNSNGKYPDVPKDLFSCNGYQGQYVFMIPLKDLVVVRTGLAENPKFNVNSFLSEVVKSVQ